ncbi:hypothetical protein MMC18_005984 [Xylographa bjoerkii]|nr:hypothetical protein [Xylographa bjoerkii]
MATTVPWDQRSEYLAARNTAAQAGDPGIYVIPRSFPTGRPQDVTSYHPGQRSWSFNNLPDIFYQLFPDVAWRTLKVNGLPEPKPDKIGTQEHVLLFESWRKLDPRIRRIDITMRMDSHERPREKTLNMQLNRKRTSYYMVSWHQRGKWNGTNLITDEIVASLPKYAMENNSTRGLAPGLIIPRMGEDGGRISFALTSGDPAQGSKQPKKISKPINDSSMLSSAHPSKQSSPERLQDFLHDSSQHLPLHDKLPAGFIDNRANTFHVDFRLFNGPQSQDVSANKMNTLSRGEVNVGFPATRVYGIPLQDLKQWPYLDENSCKTASTFPDASRQNVSDLEYESSDHTVAGASKRKQDSSSTDSLAMTETNHTISKRIKISEYSEIPATPFSASNVLNNCSIIGSRKQIHMPYFSDRPRQHQPKNDDNTTSYIKEAPEVSRTGPRTSDVLGQTEHSSRSSIAVKEALGATSVPSHEGLTQVPGRRIKKFSPGILSPIQRYKREINPNTAIEAWSEQTLEEEKDYYDFITGPFGDWVYVEDATEEEIEAFQQSRTWWIED